MSIAFCQRLFGQRRHHLWFLQYSYSAKSFRGKITVWHLKRAAIRQTIGSVFKGEPGFKSSAFSSLHFRGWKREDRRIWGWVREKNTSYLYLFFNSNVCQLITHRSIVIILVLAATTNIHSPPPSCKENVFLFWELRNLSSNFHIMCLWAIYTFPGLVHIFPCSRIGRPILEIYKSLTDIWV